MKKLLSSNPLAADFGLLILRLSVTIPLIVSHGWQKLSHFSDKMDKFPDPLHVGHLASLSMTVLAEFFCAILLALGLFSRLATVPLIICFSVILFVIHGGQSFGEHENAFLFLVAFVVLLFTGPGKYSADRMLLKR